MTLTKKSLAIILSKLFVFEKPKVELEQYPTDSEVAATLLWGAALKGDIEGKRIADLGCGTGILGIGCLLLGAKKVDFVDVDKDSLDIAKKNYEKIKNEYEISKAEFIQSDVENFKDDYDLVVENPPFGVKLEHADKSFLKKAFKIANIIYSLHKIESKNFIEAMAKDSGFEITYHEEYSFPLKQTLEYHKKRIHRIKVGGWRLEKSHPK